MNNHNDRDPPSRQRLDLQTAAQVLKQASSIFCSHMLTFILLSFLILIFRFNVENGTHFLTAFIDRDPSLKPLLNRLDIPAKKLHPTGPDGGGSAVRRRHRRPFLHLTRVGTLEDDFFSGDEEFQRSPFRLVPRTRSNASSVIFSLSGLGFSSYVVDNGIRAPEIVRSGLNFKVLESAFQSMDANNGSEDASEDESKVKQEEIVRERVVDLGFLIKGLELTRRDASALFFLVSLFSAAYGYVIAGFVVTYSWVLGIVFLAVMNHYLRRNRSHIRTLWDGSTLGLKRLSGFILMKWAVRDALSQLLGLWYFGEIEDQYSFFKIFVRLKLMPFSITASWIRGYEKETAGFMFAWLVTDLIVEFVFALDSWVAIVDSRRTGREIVKEGCYLLSTMFRPAVTIKCLEAIFCGSALKLSFAQHFGELFAMGFQSLMEVYFMVVWLIFYFAVRSKEAISLGRTFGLRDLEGFIHGRR